MLLYVTDKDGNQYKAEVESKEYTVEDRTFTDAHTRVLVTEVIHTVKITKDVAEFQYISHVTDDPASTLSHIYGEIEKRI